MTSSQLLLRSGSATERLRFDGIELGLGDRAAVEEPLGRLDLACRPALTGSLPDVLVELRLRRLSLLFASLSHPVVVDDQVGQHADPREDDDEDHPRGLPKPEIRDGG